MPPTLTVSRLATWHGVAGWHFPEPLNGFLLVCGLRFTL